MNDYVGSGGCGTHRKPGYRLHVQFYCLCLEGFAGLSLVLISLFRLNKSFRTQARMRVSGIASTSPFTLDFYGTTMQEGDGEGEGEATWHSFHT